MAEFNKDLLLAVKEHILREPDRLNMNTFAVRRDPDNPEQWINSLGRHMSWNRTGIDGSEPTSCGTVGCIAGWTCMLSGSAYRPKFGRLNYFQVGARHKLDISDTEADWLFFRLSEFVDLSPGTPEYACKVAARIDTFIKCKEEGTPLP